MKLTEIQNNQACDRFIPCRKNTNQFKYSLLKENEFQFPNNKNLQNIIPDFKTNVLNFNGQPNQNIFEDMIPSSGNKPCPKKKNSSKIIQNGETQILDIPGFQNDYYLNSIDALD